MRTILCADGYTNAKKNCISNNHFTYEQAFIYCRKGQREPLHKRIWKSEAFPKLRKIAKATTISHMNKFSFIAVRRSKTISQTHSVWSFTNARKNSKGNYHFTNKSAFIHCCEEKQWKPFHKCIPSEALPMLRKIAKATTISHMNKLSFIAVRKSNENHFTNAFRLKLYQC